MKKLSIRLAFFFIPVFLSFFSTSVIANSSAKDQQELVERSKIALQSLMADEGYKNNLASLLEKAKGVIVIPALYKAGFIIGGEGGNGVVLSKLPNGDWSYPAFVSFAGGSVGLQIGFESSEVLLTIMTDRGLKSVMNNSFTLGADVSIAAGPVGAGLSAQTMSSFDADIYSFCHSKGLFGGGSLKGSVINAKDSWNEQYYQNRDVIPEQILTRSTFKHPGAEPLRALLKPFSSIYDSHSKKPMYRPVEYTPVSHLPSYKNSEVPNTSGNLKPQDQYGFENAEPIQEESQPKELLPWQRG